jgi:hypothetical protein
LFDNLDAGIEAGARYTIAKDKNAVRILLNILHEHGMVVIRAV